MIKHEQRKNHPVNTLSLKKEEAFLDFFHITNQLFLSHKNYRQTKLPAFLRRGGSEADGAVSLSSQHLESNIFFNQKEAK
jgi:hypothetical protein